MIEQIDPADGEHESEPHYQHIPQHACTTALVESEYEQHQQQQ